MRLPEIHGVERWRIAAVGVVMTLGVALLAAALYREQIIRNADYARRHERQSLRRVRLPGIRGRILDRNGIRLAENRPSYCVAIYLEELRRPGPWSRTVDAVDRQIDAMATALGIPRTLSRTEIEIHVQRRLPLPLLAWTDLTRINPAALARLAEHADPWPGVDIFVQPEREYPMSHLASHLLGYVGRDEPRGPVEEPFDFYVTDMRGRSGAEQAFDAELAGTAGGRLIRVDARGYKHETWVQREPIPGRDVHLSLESGLQAAVEQALDQRQPRGAAVVIDVRNGEILALASRPAFDPNQFTPAPTAEHWRALLRNPHQPLLNRAITGAYPPGSTFKLVTAMAALQHATAQATVLHHCPGHINLGSLRMHCWRRSGHGPMAMREALAQSCNVYFFHQALDIGYDRLYHQAHALGFGMATGIELGGESTGLMPNAEWKRRRFNEGWWPGDTCNVSIGQGAVLTTPLQMAVMTMAFANGGILFRPTLRRLNHHPGQVVNRMAWSPTLLATLRAGMFDSVQGQSGTGARARIPGWNTAGKTGTAEYHEAGVRKKHAWMIAYAPFEQPRYALSVILEDSESGGLDAAPVIREILDALRQAEIEHRLQADPHAMLPPSARETAT